MLSEEEMLAMLGSSTMMDDLMFSACVSSSRECVELIIRAVTGISLKVVRSEVQKTIRSVSGHAVVLDALCEDSEGRMYDIEVQKRTDGAGARRARCYSAMIDANALAKGESYDKLRDSYVIFITSGDALGDGEAVYEVERVVVKSGKRYGDGTHIIHVSASLADEDTELGRVMHDMMTPEPEDMVYNAFRETMWYFKRAEGKAYMADSFDDVFEEILQRHLQMRMAEAEREIFAKGERKGERRGERRGERKGREEAGRTIVRKMLADGSVPLDKIAEFSGWSVSELEDMRRLMSDV